MGSSASSSDAPPGSQSQSTIAFSSIRSGACGRARDRERGGKTRAEMIRERPRWEIDNAGEGPPQIRSVESTTTPPTEKARPIASARSIIAEPTRSAEEPGVP